jgi:hypothetical protein
MPQEPHDHDFRNDPYASAFAYETDVFSPKYSEDSPAGKLFRATVEAKLAQSPAIDTTPGSNAANLREEWLRRDQQQEANNG